MPIAHARKKDLAHIKEFLGVPHHEAIAILDDDRSEVIIELMAERDYSRTEAIAYLEAPENQTLCETCGWTMGMVCPECEKGCGCEYRCSGWRHHEWNIQEDDACGVSNDECPECGATGYYGCHCDEYDESDDGE